MSPIEAPNQRIQRMTEVLESPRTVTSKTLSLPKSTISKKEERILGLMESWGVSQETAELMDLRNRKMKG